jgi:hypothetical protein
MHGMAYYIFLKSLRSLEEFSVARGPRARGHGRRPLPLENNSLNQYFWEFGNEAPVFL